MKNYLLVSGIVFLLVVVAHVARIAAEGTRLLKEPTFVFTSILSVALVGWACRLYRQLGQTGGSR